MSSAPPTEMPLGWREVDKAAGPTPPPPPSELEEKLLLAAHLIFEQAWSKGRVDVVDQVIGPRFVRYDANNAPDYGPQGYKDTIVKTRAAFPDLNVKILSVMAQRDRLCTQVEITGTHLGEFVGIKATGAKVNIAGMMTAVFDDDALATVGYSIYNYLSIVSTLIHAMTWWQFLLNLPAIIHQDGLGRAPDVGWGEAGNIKGWSWLLRPKNWTWDSRRNAKFMEEMMK